MPVTATKGGLKVRTGNIPEPESTGYEPRKQWFGEKGTVACAVWSRADAWICDFPGHGRFRITGSVIEACLADGASPSNLRHLLLHQVIPRLMGSRGSLIVHAAAVSLTEGKAILLFGESGRGKSTLAAACLSNGAKLLSDDAVKLEIGSDGVWVTGAYPGLRLSKGTSEQFDFSGKAHDIPGIQWGKRQSRVHQVESTNACALGAAYVLGGASNEFSGPVKIEKMTPSETLQVLVDSVFCLDPSDQNSTVRAFEDSAAAVRTGFPSYLLDFPRKLDHLPQVIAALNEHKDAL